MHHCIQLTQLILQWTWRVLGPVKSLDLASVLLLKLLHDCVAGVVHHGNFISKELVERLVQVGHQWNDGPILHSVGQTQQVG